MNLSLPGPAGQTHPECLGSQAFPGCMHVVSNCPRFLCTLCMYQGLREGKQSDSILKQLLYITHVPVKHRDN